MTSPFPEPESPDLERFTVYAKVEIVSMLRDLIDTGSLVTAYFGSDPAFAVTAVLSVNSEFEELIFDNASDELAQRRLLASDHITFVAFHGNVKLQFSARRAEAMQFEGNGAFRVRLPEQILRLQRREFFRARPPLSKPATCLVPYGDDGKSYEKLRVLDLSVGGMALLTYPEKFDLPVAKVIENCFLDLPGIGSINLSLHVRHIDRVPKDEKARRAGCEFVDMSPAARVQLQRYVNKIEADARKTQARAA